MEANTGICPHRANAGKGVDRFEMSYDGKCICTDVIASFYDEGKL